MPIESGQYCQYCADEHGRLKPFDERFENMIAWAMREGEGTTREDAEKKTLAFMGTLPAWREHPDYLAKVGR